MHNLENKLDSIIKQQKQQQFLLDVINKRLMSIEESVRLNTHSAGQTLTHTRRIQPFIDKAMKTLHKAFEMVANGILNLREETSEFAGTVLETSLDIQHLNIRKV